MTSSFLASLCTNKFVDDIGVVLPPSPMRRALHRSKYVKELLSAIRYGQVTATEIQKFVSALMETFRPGEVFQHDVALAALAVAMEHWPDSFAEKYLIDLARVQRQEFRCSFRVARECLRARYSRPRTEVRTHRYPATFSRVSRHIRTMPTLRRSQQEGPIRWVSYREVANATS